MGDEKLNIYSRWHELTKRDTWIWVAVGLLVVGGQIAVADIVRLLPAPLFLIMLLAGIGGGPMAMLLLMVEIEVYTWFAFGMPESIEATVVAILMAIVIERLVIQAEIGSALTYIETRLEQICDLFDEVLANWMQQTHNANMNNLASLRNELANLKMVAFNRLAIHREASSAKPPAPSQDS